MGKMRVDECFFSYFCIALEYIKGLSVRSEKLQHPRNGVLLEKVLSVSFIIFRESSGGVWVLHGG